MALAASYVALNAPRVELLAARGPAGERAFEWLVPVGLVAGALRGFVAAQLTAMFGGHDYVRGRRG